MLVEIDGKRKIAYLHTRDELKNCKYLSKEIYDNTYVYKVVHDTQFTTQSNDILIEETLKEIICKCGRVISFQQINRLPEEGWEELVDHWSCHNSEFRGMLKLKPLPRKNGLLFSHFYFIANGSEVCCFNRGVTSKIYLYEISSINIYKLVYTFFKQYFVHKRIFIFRAKDVNYQVNFFDYTVIMDDTIYYEAIKVGYKITNKIVPESENINDYVALSILSMLEKNNTGIKISAFCLSYIF